MQSATCLLLAWPCRASSPVIRQARRHYDTHGAYHTCIPVLYIVALSQRPSHDTDFLVFSFLVCCLLLHSGVGSCCAVAPLRCQLILCCCSTQVSAHVVQLFHSDVGSYLAHLVLLLLFGVSSCCAAAPFRCRLMPLLHWDVTVPGLFYLTMLSANINVVVIVMRSFGKCWFVRTGRRCTDGIWTSVIGSAFRCVGLIGLQNLAYLSLILLGYYFQVNPSHCSSNTIGRYRNLTWLCVV
jgi:hypothetical protein